MEYSELANEVAILLSKGESFRAAAGQVLRQYGIGENWSLHMSEIGKLLGRRKKRKQKAKPISREDALTEAYQQLALEDATAAEQKEVS